MILEIADQYPHRTSKTAAYLDNITAAGTHCVKCPYSDLLRSVFSRIRSE